MTDVENLKLLYFQNDEPCPYKLRCDIEIKIYPIKVKDWSVFENSLDILQIDKNEINDINVIQMSYLDFIVKYLISEDETYGVKLSNIIKYSLKEDDIRIGKDNKGKVVLLIVKNNKIKEIITSKDFDEIRDIILFQNLTKYDNRYLSPEIREEIKSYYNLKYKDSYIPSLEEMKTYTIAKTGILMGDINDMTYRTFSQVYQSCVDTDIYFGQKIIQGSYKYKVDEDIKYPLYEKKKDVLDEVFSMSDEQMVNKVNQVNG